MNAVRDGSGRSVARDNWLYRERTAPVPPGRTLAPGPSVAGPRLPFPVRILLKTGISVRTHRSRAADRASAVCAPPAPSGRNPSGFARDNITARVWIRAFSWG